MRLFLFGSLLLANIANASIPHLDLEMTGREYRLLEEKSPVSLSKSNLDHILAFGKRNLDWLDHINKFQKEKLSFSNKENMQGFPPESPRVYNEKLVIEQYDNLVSQLPVEMRQVLIEKRPFTDNPPIEVSEYLQWAFKADRAYQIAARWLTLSPYLWQLKARRADDVRGYYFIEKNPESSNKLQNFNSLPNSEKEQYTDWLVGVCINTERSATGCRRKLDAAVSSGAVLAFYERYKLASKSIYNRFFAIPAGATYSGLEWNKKNQNLAVAPFVNPVNDVYRHFLKFNLEQEWQFNDWKLEIQFTNKSDAVEVHWEPGVTPHVPGLGSPNIYMDSNSLLSEWDVQWTIRHEFGHVLGLPDCYHEFYDDEKGVIISYQLDTTNLMCSRRGVLQEKHVKELERAYL